MLHGVSHDKPENYIDSRVDMSGWMVDDIGVWCERIDRMRELHWSDVGVGARR